MAKKPADPGRTHSAQVSKARIKETAEIFTPPALINEILDQLPQEIWYNPEKTWLEPTCGDGNFLIVIHDRLMISLKEWEPDDDKRHQHIIENMLYGVEFMPDNAEACIERLNATHLNHNIVCADGLAYDYNFGQDDVDEAGFVTKAQPIAKKPGLNAWYPVSDIEKDDPTSTNAVTVMDDLFTF